MSSASPATVAVHCSVCKECCALLAELQPFDACTPVVPSHEDAAASVLSLLHASDDTEQLEATIERAQEAAPKAPVFAIIRGALPPAIRARILNNGCVCVLQEPLEGDELRAWLGKHLSLERDRRSLRKQSRELASFAERTHADLRVSERRAAKLFASMAEGFCLLRVVCDEDAQPTGFKFLSVNDAYVELVGKPRKELIGADVESVCLSIDEEHSWRPRMLKVVTSGEPHEYEAYYQELGKWLELRIYSPAPLELGVLVIDITDRKRAEATMQQANRDLEAAISARTYQLQALIDLSRDLTKATTVETLANRFLQHLQQFVGSHATALLLAQETGCQLYTYWRGARDDSRHQALHELLHNLPCPNPEQESCTTGDLQEQSVPTPDDAEWVHLSLRQGKLVLLWLPETEEALSPLQQGAVQAMGQQLMLSLQRLHHLTQAEQRRLANVVENLTIGLVVIDSDQRIQIANPAACTLLSCEQPEHVLELLSTAIGMSMSEFLPQRKGKSRRLEVEAPHESDRQLSIQADRAEVRPSVHGWIIIVEDVTRERKIQAHVGQQERLAAVGELAAGIAHDFNNALTTIMGQAQLLSMRNDLPPKEAERAEIIYKQGRKSADLVQQILDFGRKSPSSMEPVEVVDFVTRIKDLLERTIPERVIINFEAKTQHCWVMADANQLEHALMNLAVNGTHAMPDGGRLTLVVDCLEVSMEDTTPIPELTVGQWLLLSVTDTGIGIEPEHLPHVFEPFFTTRERGAGTGLGLAQVYGLIRKHNGYIDVQSQVGAGTTFTIYLPSINPDASSEVMEETDTLMEQTFSSEGFMVLLVEDDDSVREVLRSMLLAAGTGVITARDGEEAISIYSQKQEQINLIITDMMMPRVGGEVLYRRIRETGSMVDFVFTTGYVLPEKRQQLRREGGTHWLEKPVKLKDLQELLATLRGL